jgi:lysozyme
VTQAPVDAQPQDVEAEAVRLAAGLCRRFEGLMLRPYLCPAGVPSIGYGITRYSNGMRVTLADPAIDAQRAEAELLWHLRHVCLPAVIRCCPAVSDPGQLAALLDFVFNLGEGNLRASTLRKRILANRWDLVPAEFRRWIFAAGKKLTGLALRRDAEVSLLSDRR